MPNSTLIRSGIASAMLLAAVPLHAQDNNFHLPIAEIEQRLRADFEIGGWQGSRMPQDRTQRVTLVYPDSSAVVVKWANAPRGGGEFNNEPRYETAAYELQKLFLEPADYVVPPTVMRAFPLDFVSAHIPGTRATFREAPGSVLVALQYWMLGVRQVDFWVRDRARADTAYARHIGNFNMLTYLIRHRDANAGNFLISTDTTNPRVFAVDNGVAFDSKGSDRGEEWRYIQVERLPGYTIDRLENLTLEDLDRALGVLIEFEIRDGELIEVERGANLNPGRPVRVQGNRLQIGLTQRELRDVDSRLRNLVKQARDGRHRIF